MALDGVQGGTGISGGGSAGVVTLDLAVPSNLTLPGTPTLGTVMVSGTPAINDVLTAISTTLAQWKPPTGGTGGGTPPTLAIGTVSTLPASQSATASITGTAPNYFLNIGIPAGATGAPGTGFTIVGSVATSSGLPPASSVNAGDAYVALDTSNIWVSSGGSSAIWTNVGSVQGPPGAAATVTVGSTAQGAVGTNASVTNTGSTSAAVLNFTIPTGATGAAGTPGTPGGVGPAGPAPTLTIGTVTSVPSGTAPTVNISGSNPYTLDFQLEAGTPGGSGGLPGVTVSAAPGAANQALISSSASAAGWSSAGIIPNVTVTNTPTANQVLTATTTTQAAWATPAPSGGGGGGFTTAPVNVTAGATPATLTVNALNIVTAGTGGVIWSSGVAANAQMLVRNDTASPVNIFPVSGGVINSLATNASMSLPADTTAMLFAASPTRILTVP